MAKSLLNKPRPASGEQPTKVERQTAELELSTAEEVYHLAKLKGLDRIAKERASAFAKASSWEEYHQAIEKIAPAVSAATSDKLRNLRYNHRTDWRRPVGPGEGAAPGVLEVAAQVKEPG